MQQHTEPDTFVTVDSTDVRAGPAESEDRIAVLPKGTEVTVLSEADGWYRVEIAGGVPGFVAMAAILKLDAIAQESKDKLIRDRMDKVIVTAPKGSGEPTPWGELSCALRPAYWMCRPPNVSSVQAADTAPATFVTVGSTDVRAGPAASEDRIAILSEGTEVTVLGKTEDGGWYRIEVAKGLVGFVAAAQLQSLGS